MRPSNAVVSTGLQSALEKVSPSLQDAEPLCAFLDDVYVLCGPE